MYRERIPITKRERNSRTQTWILFPEATERDSESRRITLLLKRMQIDFCLCKFALFNVLHLNAYYN